jgi:NDP-sugar pyrophosphorylase family protein
LQAEKTIYKGYILQHADTINAVPLKDILSFHENKKSEATIVAKPKKELG